MISVKFWSCKSIESDFSHNQRRYNSYYKAFAITETCPIPFRGAIISLFTLHRCNVFWRPPWGGWGVVTMVFVRYSVIIHTYIETLQVTHVSSLLRILFLLTSYTCMVLIYVHCRVIHLVSVKMLHWKGKISWNIREMQTSVSYLLLFLL